MEMFSASVDVFSLFPKIIIRNSDKSTSREVVLYLFYLSSMADQNSAQEKTEDPTPRKLEKAREEGNVSVSKEISSVMLMLVSLFTFIGMGSFMYQHAEAVFEIFFLNSAMPIDNQNQAIMYLKVASTHAYQLMLPLFMILLATALFVNLVQTKAAFSFKAIQPKGSKINPVNGIKRVFSKRGLVELAKGLFKLLVMGVIVYSTIQDNIEHFVSFAIMPLEYNISESGSHILLFVTKVLAALLVMSIADAAYQQYQHKQDLKMSKQEVKDEHKQSEGDPKMKGKRKQLGMSLRKKRLDHAVLDSDVVVTNPVHYAIALQYDPDETNAPVVMAKGQRLRAQKIKKLAREYDIPIVENKPVAQALFASAEVDEFIPEDLFRAVAEILAYVYKLKNKHNI